MIGSRLVLFGLYSQLPFAVIAMPSMNALAMPAIRPGPAMIVLLD